VIDGLLDDAAARGQRKRQSLLALEPDLEGVLEPAELPAARRVSVTSTEVRPGPWRPSLPVDAASGNLGFLVIDGLLMRSVSIAGTRCTELLGPGDLLRPWSMDTEELSSVPIEAEWKVVDRPARFAVLDRGATAALGRWPELTCELVDRIVRRARWLSFQLAVCHTRQLRRRLLMILWHFADRWGHVTPEGRVVQIQVSHATIGEIVGARRPSVTGAIGELQTEGRIRRLDDGGWVLLGDPPGYVGEPALGGSEPG
jgi:hypothetical protein